MESNHTKEFITEAVGWVGVTLILVAFGLVSLGVITGTSLLFLLFNLFGAIGVGIDAFADKNIQPVILNAVWALIALCGIVKFFL